jgi:DNA-binding response OmpR family regulator
MSYVLIIGDGPDAASIELGLGESGVRCVRVDDAVKALVFARREPPDVILLDTDASGFGSAKRLNYRLSEKRVPILLLASPEQADIFDMARADGFDGCVRKPVDVGAVVPLVREHLDEREGERCAE